MTIATQDLLNGTHPMNTTGDSSTYHTTSLYEAINGDLFYNNLPDIFKQHIKIVRKSTGDTYDTVYTEDMKIFLPSEIEVTGSQQYATTANEGNQYDRFKNSLSRVKNINWWLRSPHVADVGGDYFFCVVTPNGNVNFDIDYFSNAVVLPFAYNK